MLSGKNIRPPEKFVLKNKKRPFGLRRENGFSECVG
jgi:hypothetical protein